MVPSYNGVADSSENKRSTATFINSDEQQNNIEEGKQVRKESVHYNSIY